MAALKWLDRRVAHPGPHLALCLTPEQFAAAVKYWRIGNAGPWLNPGADATHHNWVSGDDGDPISVVCLHPHHKIRTGVVVAGLLVHEAVHAWQHYCDRIGEKAPGREQEAYAIQNIAQELMDDYVRQAVT